MTIFNRLLVIALALAVIAAAVITLLVATEVSGAGVLGGGFESELEWVADASGGTAAAIIAVSIVVLLLALVLALVEIVPRRRPVSLLIGTTQDGMATIDRDSVCQLAEKTAATFREVRESKCGLQSKSGGIEISCRATVALGANVPELSEGIQAKVRESVEQLTGLAVRAVDVRAKYEPVESRHLAVR